MRDPIVEIRCESYSPTRPTNSPNPTPEECLVVYRAMANLTIKRLYRIRRGMLLNPKG